MAKFYGAVGYSETVEITPGRYEEAEVTERMYYGDVIKVGRKFQNGDKVISDLTIHDDLSILADPYAMDHFHNMKYVKMYGAAWEITDVQVNYPRLRLTIGGVYNGPLADS